MLQTVKYDFFWFNISNSIHSERKMRIRKYTSNILLVQPSGLQLCG